MIQDYLDETRSNAHELLESLSKTNADPQIGRAVQDLLDALPEQFSDLERDTLFPLCRAVDVMAKKHDVVYDKRELSSVTLAELESLSIIARRLYQCLPIPAEVEGGGDETA